MSEPLPAASPVDPGAGTVVWQEGRTATTRVEQKQACPECGADLVWMPQHQSLGCAYCGTILPRAPAMAGDPPADRGASGMLPLRATVVEQDLLEALRNPATGRDWGSDRREVQCRSCQAISIFVDGRVAQACDFCGSPSILTHEAHGDAITPQSVLPFRLERTAVLDKVRVWYGNRWFAPRQLRVGASTDQLHGIYLPYWTFDARVAARWTAEAGRTSWVTRQVRGADGHLRAEQVRQVQWQPAAGRFEHFFDDELVPGSGGVHAALIRAIEPFPTTLGLKDYSPDYVRGWTVERYQIDLREAQSRNLDAMQAKVRAMAAGQVPGDTQRNLQVAAEFTGRTFKHVLVPVWLVSYRYNGKPYQVAVNGWTGAIAGERPYSWIKIALAVLVALIVLAVVAASQR